MSSNKKTSRTERNRTAVEGIALSPPGDFIELAGLHIPSIIRRLGYLGSDPFVLVGYCPWVFDVIWRDGRAFGFGNDGWRTYLLEIAPRARRCGANIGTTTCLGTHVLFFNRLGKGLYAAPRESAEIFLAHLYGKPPPTRPCLCSRTSCVHCPPPPPVRSEQDSGEAPCGRRDGFDSSRRPPVMCVCTDPA
jgi:hypothetical protein